jgi:hypothetical protein
MTNLVSSSKQKTSALNSVRGSSNSNVADLNSKVQNSSLLSATVSETRPGGDVILATANGFIRSSSKFDLSVGDKVSVRISYIDNGEIKAQVVETDKVDMKSDQAKTTSSILMKYISELISGNKDLGDESEAIYAKFSYISPNRNLLKYGHIAPGDLVKVQILTPKDITTQRGLLSGTIISNDGGVLSINSPLGIINLQTNSDYQPAQKILFKLINIPEQEQLKSVANSIIKFISNISLNISNLKQILVESKNLDNTDRYKNLLQLVTMHHDGATLAKLFHQTRNIPASDIERWIEEEIVEPFEASSKGNKLTLLSQSMEDIGLSLEQMNIIQPGPWRSIPIPIYGTDQYAKLQVKIENNILNFQIEINHPELGKMILGGMIELRGKNRQISNMAFNIKHTNKFPQQLMDSITSIFAEHKILANIEGGIEFMKSEEV